MVSQTLEIAIKRQKQFFARIRGMEAKSLEKQGDFNWGENA